MKYLIDADFLEKNLDNYYIIDLRSMEEYSISHVQGAVLSPSNIHFTDENHNLIKTNDFLILMGRLGINNYTNIIVYDSNLNKTSCIFWYMMHHYGHKGEILILNGGYSEVENNDNIPKQNTYNIPPLTSYTPKITENYVYYLNDLIKNYDKVKILDTRSSAEWDKQTYYNNPRMGNLPGAIFLDFSKFLTTKDGYYKIYNSTALELEAENLGLEKEDLIVTYCQHGARAALAGIALRTLGYKNVIIYEGSMYEWSRNISLALE
ncbi:MAG: rhodanese-like domain-containing protein [Defluviitaleaceae bacterium]|nr:rhodanese-like domain-containing protein [Defluviitaleaceae bacterium]